MMKILFSVIVLLLGLHLSQMQIELKKQYSIKDNILQQLVKYKEDEKKLELIDYKEFQYFAEMSIGEPAINMTITLDTGSTYFWIPMKNQKYDREKSTSSVITEEKRELQYGSGFITGLKGQEKVSVEHLNLDKIQVNDIVFAQAVHNAGLKSDGILGLSNDINNDNLFELAVKQGQLKDAVFAFDLKSHKDKTFFYVGYDSFPEEDKKQLKWINSSRTDYWSISIDHILIGEDIDNKITIDYQPDAVIDSGTSLLLISQSAYNALMNNKAISENCQEDGAHISCSCFEYQIFPTLFFKPIGQDFYLPVEPEDYLIELSFGQCLLGVQPSHYGFMLFGDAFMRNYFIAYNEDGNDHGGQIGFSREQKKHYDFNKFFRGSVTYS